MCKTKSIDWSLVKASKVISLLKNFPACGVRYKTDGNYGIVLVHPRIKDQALVAAKRNAAKIKASKEVYIVSIPLKIAQSMGI